MEAQMGAAQQSMEDQPMEPEPKGTLVATKLVPRYAYAQLGLLGDGNTLDKEDQDQEGNSIQFQDLKLPASLSNCIRVQPEAFDADKYQVEPNIEYKDEKGILITKTLPVSNFIRWRHAKEQSDEQVIDLERSKLVKQVGLNFQPNEPKVSFAYFKQINDLRCLDGEQYKAD